MGRASRSASSAHRRDVEQRSFGQGRKKAKVRLNGKRHREDAEDGDISVGSHVDLGLYKLALKDLARSGLDKRDFKKLRLEVLDRDQTDEFVGEQRASCKIPYFDLDGKRIAYSRVRFLENRKRKAFHRETRDGTFRYSQPFNSSPHVYFPPYFNWRKLAKDPEQKILITEGEKKAAAACKAGIACIALGGVFAFQSSKRHQDVIPDLELIQWKGRDVEICYDADVMLKREVSLALDRLAHTLMSRGPKSISYIHFDVEGPAGAKTGLDDFIVERGAEAFEALERKSHDGADKLQLLNSKLCWVEKEHQYYDIDNRRFFKSSHNVREAFMPSGRIFNGTAKGSLIIDEWMEWPLQRRVKDINYMPGQPDVTPQKILNTWSGPNLQPKKGKPERWLDLVRYVMREGEYFDWFMQWLAYPVQHPGAKLFQACFVFGQQTGVGKTFIVDPVMEFIYGKQNFHRPSSDDLTSKHNTFAGNSVFVVTNEVWLPDFKDRTSAMSVLKDMITRERVTIDEKFQPKIKFDDHCNYYFTSNHADALVLEKDDRRFFVIEAPKKKLATSTYRELDAWMRTGDGAANILHHLQGVDCSKFDPKAPVLETKWREQLIGLSRDPLTDFVDRLANNPAPLFMVNGNMPDLQLYRAEDLAKMFESAYPKYRFNVTPARMSRLLQTAKVERRHVRVSKREPHLTLYSIFKAEAWGLKRNVDWAEHYTDKSRLYGGKSKT